MIVGSWDDFFDQILFSKGWPDRSSSVRCYKEKVPDRSGAFCRATEAGKLRFVRSTSTHEPPPMPPLFSLFAPVHLMKPREFFINPADYGLPTRKELVAYRIWDNHFHGFLAKNPIEQYERNSGRAQQRAF